MRCKIFNLLFFFVLSSCVSKPLIETKDTVPFKSFFLIKGFALVYDEKLYKEKLIKGKIDDRSLIIFQKNLTKNTSVKITNLLNSKYIIAKVGSKKEYPSFYNSVISKRIKDELELDVAEPYIEIKEIVEGSSFISKKAKTYDEEKKVANKAPVDDIQIKELRKVEKSTIQVKKDKFNYIIKVGDFYFKKSAKFMKSRIFTETKIKKININKLSSTKFRVFIGPYDNLNSLKKSFNAISILKFDSVEIIKK